MPTSLDHRRAAGGDDHRFPVELALDDDVDLSLDAGDGVLQDFDSVTFTPGCA
jgi:hypothetical protein